VRGGKQLDKGIDDTFVSSVRQEFSSPRLIFRTSWMGKAVRLGLKALRSIRKYGQYHRPIARPILFWLNGGSFMLPGGLCRPSDDFGSEF